MSQQRKGDVLEVETRKKISWFQRINLKRVMVGSVFDLLKWQTWEKRTSEFAIRNVNRSLLYTHFLISEDKTWKWCEQGSPQSREGFYKPRARFSYRLFCLLFYLPSFWRILGSKTWCQWWMCGGSIAAALLSFSPSLSHRDPILCLNCVGSRQTV